MDQQGVNEPEQAPHVLVVDDEESILSMISLHLSRRGFRVSTVPSATDAHVLVDHHAFDAILTDVSMPGENGIDFLERVHQKHPSVPVIIMTGYAQLEMAVKAIKHGAFAFLHKPFDFDYLFKEIKKAVDYTRLRKLEENYLTELEEIVSQRTAELKNALAELEQARVARFKTLQEKSDFMSTITHEMRTPMNGVIGSLELLAEEDLNGVQREYLQLARQSADNMMALVNRLLSFSDGVSRLPQIKTVTIATGSFFESIARQHRSGFSRKGLFFDMMISPLVPSHFVSDKDLLTRLLDILLVNAFKFTDRGSVWLQVSPGEGGEGEFLHVSVSDSGPGIPGDLLERIFEPFFQVDGSITRRYGGAGLGLSIARQIAPLLEGEVQVESTIGHGSTFHFRMKLRQPENDQSTAGKEMAT